MKKDNHTQFFSVVDGIADQLGIQMKTRRFNLKAIWPDLYQYLLGLPPETQQQKDFRLAQQAHDILSAWDDSLKQNDDELQMDLFAGEHLYRLNTLERIRAKHVGYTDLKDVWAFKRLLHDNAEDAFMKSEKKYNQIFAFWDVKRHKVLPDVLKAMKKAGL